MAAVGVAAVATAEVVGGGKDEVRAFHVEVFGAERLVGERGLTGGGLGCFVVEAIGHEKRPGEGVG